MKTAAILYLLFAMTATAGSLYPRVVVPETKNLYIPQVADYYREFDYHKAMSTLQDASSWKGNSASDKVWIDMMEGVLTIELPGYDRAMEQAVVSFKRALSTDPSATLPLDASPAVRKAFAKARDEIAARPAPGAPDDRPRASPPNPPLAETRSAMTSEPSTDTAQQTNTVSVGLRVVGESLAGGLCAGILGGIGFRVGASAGRTYGIALVGAGLGLMVGAGAGSWLGVQLVGSWLGGRGNPWFTLLGAAGGMLAGFLVATFIPSLGLAAIFLLPLAGAVLGYEATSTPPSPRVALHEESRARILPVIGLAPGGRGVLPGLAGTF